MQSFESEIIKELLAAHQPPCVSLYQPTHRLHTGREEDTIRFKNLLAEIERVLWQKHSKSEAERLLSRLREYERSLTFWNHQLEGLAMFICPDLLHVVHLQRPVPQLAVVSESFHVKPLLRILQSADRFQVLCVSQKSVSLYEGDRYKLDEITLENVPRSLTDALGEELTQPYEAVVSARGPGAPPIRYGQGDRKDEKEIDVERYLRIIDRAILDHYSRPSGLPLMLAALPEYHSVFRRVSRNPNLLETGIEFHPGRLDADRLRKEAWKLFEPWYHSRVSRMVDQFKEALSHQAGSDDLSQVAQAAIHGRISAALVDADRRIPGRMDATSGNIEFGLPSEPAAEDLLDDIAERILTTGGMVYVLQSDEMPTATGVAAIYRF